MSVSSDPEHYFQTTSSIADIERKKRKAANTRGDPIKLPTKILAANLNLAFDQSGDVVFVAEAGGTLSAVRLSTGEISRVGKPSTAPLTCITNHVYNDDPSDKTSKRVDIYAGCWDKTVTRYSFGFGGDNAPGVKSIVSQSSFKAHGDFVKCVLIAQTADGRPILVSGGADGDVNFWNITDTTDTPATRIATVKPGTRGIECLALDPFSDVSSPTIVISTSQRELFTLALPDLASMSSPKLQSALSTPLVAHETSVYALHFDAQGDLWTASADKTSKRLVRDNGWTADTTLVHPDFVRDVTTHPVLPYVITACRDEDVRVWNKDTGSILHVFTGHWEEVTGVLVTGTMCVSISIDASMRRWSLKKEDWEREKQTEKLLENEPETKVDPGFGLSAEEEAELDALMEEEETDELEKMAVDT